MVSVWPEREKTSFIAALPWDDGDMEQAVAVIPLVGLLHSYQLSIWAQYDK